MEPVAEVLEQARDAEKSAFRGVFVHVMSNGKLLMFFADCPDLCLFVYS